MSNAPKAIALVKNTKTAPEPLIQVLKKQGYSLDIYESGEKLFAKLLEHPQTYNTLILDYQAPPAEGMGLLAKINTVSTLKLIPIIMIIPDNHKNTLEAVIHGGARYCLLNSFDRDLILKIVHVAIQDHENTLSFQHRNANSSHVSSAHNLMSAQFQIKFLHEAQELSHFLSQACPNPNLAVVGILELLINAIEHGNLGIAYDEKSVLKRNNTWVQSIEERLMQPEHRHKKVDVVFARNSAEIKLQITDDGPGFHWEKYATFDPERVFHTHGRGITIAKDLTFSEINYIPPGNRVICHIPLKQQLVSLRS